MSRASGGLADFPALQVFAPAGSYILEFTPFAAPSAALRPARLRLTLRACAAGEARVRGAPADAALRAVGVYEKCEVCRFGTYRCGLTRLTGLTGSALARCPCLHPWAMG